MNVKGKGRGQNVPGCLEHVRGKDMRTDAEIGIGSQKGMDQQGFY